MTEEQIEDQLREAVLKSIPEEEFCPYAELLVRLKRYVEREDNPLDQLFVLHGLLVVAIKSVNAQMKVYEDAIKAKEAAQNNKKDDASDEA